jgi:hypothetical protein
MRSIWKVVIIVALALAAFLIYGKLKTAVPSIPSQELAENEELESRRDMTASMEISGKNDIPVEETVEKADIPDFDAFEGIEEELNEFDFAL